MYIGQNEAMAKRFLPNIVFKTRKMLWKTLKSVLAYFKILLFSFCNF
jgi:hypothetical protein